MKRRDFLKSSAALLPLAACGFATDPLADSSIDSFAALSRSGSTSPSSGPVFGSLLLANEVANNSALRSLITATCNEVVSNELFFALIHPTQATYDFTRLTRVLDFAAASALPVRAHALVWHQQIPAWMSSVASGSHLQVMTAHIDKVVRTVRGRIRYYDVVNEVISVADGRADGLRLSPWLNWIGPSYIDQAFKAAAAADSKALLGLNEYGLDDDSPAAIAKRAAVLALIQSLRSRNVPIHYLGIQAHINPSQNFTSPGLGQFIKDVQQLGLQVFVTELDVDDFLLPSDIATRDGLVRDCYARYVDVVQAAGVTRIHTWGMADHTSWLQGFHPRTDGLPQRPLPFDSAYKAKAPWQVLRSRGFGKASSAG